MLVYYKLCGISVPPLLLDYFPYCNEPSHHPCGSCGPAAAFVSLQWPPLGGPAAQILPCTALGLWWVCCWAALPSDLENLGYVNHQGRVKGTFTPLGFGKKQNDCCGCVVRNWIVYKVIVLVGACSHPLVDLRCCDRIICALDQDEIQKQIGFQHSVKKSRIFVADTL